MNSIEMIFIEQIEKIIRNQYFKSLLDICNVHLRKYFQYLLVFFASFLKSIVLRMEFLRVSSIYQNNSTLAKIEQMTFTWRLPILLYGMHILCVIGIKCVSNLKLHTYLFKTTCEYFQLNAY